MLSCFQVPSTEAEKSDSSVLLKKDHVEKGQSETTAIPITPLETFYGESHLKEQYLFFLSYFVLIWFENAHKKTLIINILSPLCTSSKKK